MQSRRRKRLPGFTLVEVIVSFGIGGIVFLSLYAGLAHGFDSVRRAQYRLRATQILTEKLEVIRLYNWTQVNTPGFIPATFIDYYRKAGVGPLSSPGIAYNGTITLTSAPVQPAYTNTMRKIVAQIIWIDHGITNRQSMETLISEYGIQNYIY